MAAAAPLVSHEHRRRETGIEQFERLDGTVLVLGADAASELGEAYGVSERGNFERGTSVLRDLARKPRGELAAGVSAAGGLGVIGAASLNAEGLREEIKKVRGLTDRPFGVDLLFATIGRPPAGEAAAAFTREVQAQIDVVFE